MTIKDLRESGLAGVWGLQNIFGMVVKFNTKLNNTGEFHLNRSDLPVFFKNDYCVIYSNIFGKKMRHIRKRYGVAKVEINDSTLKLLSARIGQIPFWIEVSDVTPSTPISEVEDLCENVFTIKK